MKDEKRILIERLASLSRTPTKVSKPKLDKGDAKLMDKAVKKAVQTAVNSLSAAFERRFNDLEQKCFDSILRSTQDIKRDIVVNDARVSQLESKLLGLSTRLEELALESEKKLDAMRTEIGKIESTANELVETERTKRVSMVKKAQEQTKQQFVNTEAFVQNTIADQSKSIRDLRDDFRSQTNEIAGLKLKFDDM